MSDSSGNEDNGDYRYDFENDYEFEPSSPEIPYQNINTSTPIHVNSRYNGETSGLGDVTNTQLILDELKKTNSRLDEFGETLKSVQQRIQMVEKDITSMGTSSNADTSIESHKKVKVPPKIRVGLNNYKQWCSKCPTPGQLVAMTSMV